MPVWESDVTGNLTKISLRWAPFIVETACLSVCPTAFGTVRSVVAFGPFDTLICTCEW